MHFSPPQDIAGRLIYYFSSLSSSVYCLPGYSLCLDMLFLLIHSCFTLIFSSFILHFFQALREPSPCWIDGYRNHCIISTFRRPFLTMCPPMFGLISWFCFMLTPPAGVFVYTLCFVSCRTSLPEAVHAWACVCVCVSLLSVGFSYCWRSTHHAAVCAA